MKEFNSLAAFASHLLAVEAAEVLALHHGLKAVAKAIEATAKAEIGHYQPAVGPFQAWPELADSTKADRVRQGFSENDPLLRTGEMRDSISHEVSGLEAVIGSDSDVMVWQELGTKTIPPRPVLGPAALLNEEKIKEILGKAAARGLLGGASMPAGLGYEFDT
jgi:phage gpG-like protein